MWPPCVCLLIVWPNTCMFELIFQSVVCFTYVCLTWWNIQGSQQDLCAHFVLKDKKTNRNSKKLKLNLKASRFAVLTHCSLKLKIIQRDIFPMKRLQSKFERSRQNLSLFIRKAHVWKSTTSLTTLRNSRLPLQLALQNICQTSVNWLNWPCYLATYINYKWN